MEMCTNIIPLKAENREAPKYIKVLPLGYVSSEKGNFLVDSESFRTIKRYIQSRGVDVVVDYEHQTLKDVQAPAGGWIKDILLKDDGIFAKVEWTHQAKAYIVNREYRYLSPVVQVQNGKVTDLHSVALTNTPAIHGMTPIANSLAMTDSSVTEAEQIKHEILRMLGISEKDFEKYSSIMEEN